MKKSELRQLIKEELLKETGMFSKIKNMGKNLKFPKLNRELISRYKYAKAMEKLIKDKLNETEQKELQTLLMRSVMDNKLNSSDTAKSKELWLKVYDGFINPSHIDMVWYPFDESDMEDEEQ